MTAGGPCPRPPHPPTAQRERSLGWCAPLPPRRNSGLWCVSTRRDQHKAQKEMWLVSGLQDHRYLSKKNRHSEMPPPPPAYVGRSTATRVNNPGRPRGRAALSVPRGRCSRWCRFRVHGAQSLVCRGCAEWGMVCQRRPVVGVLGVVLVVVGVV